MMMDNYDAPKKDFFQCHNSRPNLVFDRPDAAQAKWMQLAGKD